MSNRRLLISFALPYGLSNASLMKKFAELADEAGLSKEQIDLAIEYLESRRGKAKTYHGWIYVDRDPAHMVQDHFSVQYRQNHFAAPPVEREGLSITQAIGYGKAAEAVDFFESKLKRRVSLEPTPIGLRVFTVDGEGD